ncbi:MAG: hypothetical protein V2I57_14850 [Xanthomonadales bacterium]|nr:hypothetical protein [Xanthomonadales bacterium]
MNRNASDGSDGEDGRIEDPLGLGDLPLIDPPRDGWNDIRAVLAEDQRASRRQRLFRGLAVAACLVAVVSVVLWRAPAGPSDPAPAPGPALVEAQSEEAVTGDTAIPTNPEATVTELIAMSQLLEQRLRLLRDDTVSMPAESVVYVAELEDLVARVDDELSVTPESIELWSQRVNLLLDLEALFQHQFETEYGRMASL